MSETGDQIRQFNRIAISYRTDIKTLNDILDSWKSEKTSVDDLAEQIKSSVKNAADISIKVNENNQYLVEFAFKPIRVSLIIEKHNH